MLSGDWAFIEDYRQQVIGAAVFICESQKVQYDLMDYPSSQRAVFNEWDTWRDLGYVQIRPLFDLQSDLQRQLDIEHEAGTPVPKGTTVRTEAFTVLEIIEFLPEERQECS